MKTHLEFVELRLIDGKFERKGKTLIPIYGNQDYEDYIYQLAIDYIKLNYEADLEGDKRLTINSHRSEIEGEEDKIFYIANWNPDRPKPQYNPGKFGFGG